MPHTILLELLPLLAAFAVTVLLVFTLNPLAQRIGWLDNPDARKGNPPKKPLGSKVENSRNMTRGGSTCANPSLPTARSWQS
jgi:hypothetical protein